MSTDPAKDLDDRLARLEESVLYAERAGDQLSQSMAELSRTLTLITNRLARLEARLGTVEERALKDPASEPGSPDPDQPDPS